MGEGSHWLWLGPISRERPRIGVLLAAAHFADRASLLEWIAQQRINSELCQLAAGQFLSSSDVQYIRGATGLCNAFADCEGRAYYDSHGGAIFSDFLRNSSAATQLLHINADDELRYSVMWVAR